MASCLAAKPPPMREVRLHAPPTRCRSPWSATNRHPGADRGVPEDLERVIDSQVRLGAVGGLQRSADEGIAALSIHVEDDQ